VFFVLFQEECRASIFQELEPALNQMLEIRVRIFQTKKKERYMDTHNMALKGHLTTILLFFFLIASFVFSSIHYICIFFKNKTIEVFKTSF
jgi:ABC-type multidrug transport system permease subunit